jgi:iron only hydrogenase large subunit-like protein
MSTILSADDLNDFISPGVACIKPIETLPAPSESLNPYEVTTEDKLAAANPQPTQISLTDCLACSGCVTSAEAVLVSLQNHEEVLRALDESPGLDLPWLSKVNGVNGLNGHDSGKGKLFVMSVSPQARANLAAAYGISSEAAEQLISQFLSGPNGIGTGGKYGSKFTWVLDTNVLRSIALVSASDEVDQLLEDPTRVPNADGNLITDEPKKPILASACPGWICYAEKQHPHILPHLSRLKSPQALAGTLLKSVLYKKYNIHPSQVWHLALMPCFDKKLEASRAELTSTIWAPDSEPIRDVDCVITPRELINLAAARNISLQSLINLPSLPVIPFPDSAINAFLFPHSPPKHTSNLTSDAGSSGGYLYHILRRAQAANPGSSINIIRGRNADVLEYTLTHPSSNSPILKCARYYGFRNIQNLVRKLKPVQTSLLLAAAGRQANGTGSARPMGRKTEGVEYAYVEVMACPGGCTNGGGQIRAGEVESVRNTGELGAGQKLGMSETKAWLGSVDEAYFSADEDEAPEKESADIVDGISKSYVMKIVEHWEEITGVDRRDLVRTSYRKVESDVGKQKGNNIDRVVGLASSIGGGW